jgi:N-acetylneuraminic acid mutarotase
VVPLGLPAGQSDVKVKVGDKISIASVTFTHEQPVVSSVNPLNATFLEQVTIEGSGFSARATNNKVMFGEFNADIVRATKTSLIVKVPTGINKSSTPIIVKVDSIQSTNTFSFQLKPAIVTSIAPATANLFETVTISGDNFNPIPSLNEVFFDNNQATVTHAEKSKLTLSVPNGIYMDRELEVSLTVGGITLLVGTVQLANPWIRKADIPSGMFGRWGATGFSIEGKGYAGIGGGNGVSSAYNDFYRFDETTNTWQRIADFGGGKRYWAASFVIGKIAYIGTGSVTDAGEGTRDFYKYDAENDSWTRISDFGGAASSRAIGFSINGKGYVCRSFGTNNFWEYDPAIDLWMKKADFPAVSGDQTKRVTGAFVVNNQAYVLVTNYSQHELYLYNSSTDTWIKKNNLPHVTSGSYLPSVLSTTTHGYYFDGWTGLEYNPAQDQWRSVDFTPAIRNDSFFFSINNDIFLGGGREGNFKDFWKGETGEF